MFCNGMRQDLTDSTPKPAPRPITDLPITGGWSPASMATGARARSRNASWLVFEAVTDSLDPNWQTTFYGETRIEVAYNPYYCRFEPI